MFEFPLWTLLHYGLRYGMLFTVRRWRFIVMQRCLLYGISWLSYKCVSVNGPFLGVFFFFFFQRTQNAIIGGGSRQKEEEERLASLFLPLFSVRCRSFAQQMVGATVGGRRGRRRIQAQLFQPPRKWVLELLFHFFPPKNVQMKQLCIGMFVSTWSPLRVLLESL